MTLGLAASLTEQLVDHSDEPTHPHYTRPTAEGEAMLRAAMRNAHQEAQAA